MNSNNLQNEDADPWDSTLAGSGSMPLHDRSPPELRESVLSEEPEPELDAVSSAEQNLSSSTHSHQLSIPSIIHTPATPPANQGHISFKEPSFQKLILMETYKVLFPSLHEFKSKSVLGQIASVFAALAIFLLTLTLPVVVTPYELAQDKPEKSPQSLQDPHRILQHTLLSLDEDDEERVRLAEEEVEKELHPDTVKFNKWLTSVQCIFGPLFCVAVLFRTCILSLHHALNCMSLRWH